MNRQDSQINTLIRVIEHLSHVPGKGITFINGNSGEDILYYDQLLAEATYVLGGLQRRGIHVGSELILQVEDNKKLLVLFWACILGKIIPVPLSAGNQDDHKLKLFKVYSALTNPYLVCDKVQLERLDNYAKLTGNEELFSGIKEKTLLTDEPDGHYIRGIIQHVSADDIAYIQFSSGSTGEPKGVTLTHANLIANISDIAGRSGVTSHDRMLSWMPLTHDMGLICFHLTGMISGAAQYLMPAALFIRRPLLWIEKANEYKATLLYSPNFGYSYFLTAFKSSKEKVDWDLSAIRLIYNGAEPISHVLCEAFIDALSEYGLPVTAMYPGYGLAEASVAVCLPNPGDKLRSYDIDRKSLHVGKKVKLVHDKNTTSVSFMEVGYPLAHCRVRIADDKDEEIEEGCVGNIQIKGANVMGRYYNNPAATAKIFTLDEWLQTGDLGFFMNGRLVVTGRAKNIIILFGQNYYPQDIERAAEQVPGAGPGKVVACGVKDPASWKEELVLFVLFKEKPEQFIPVMFALRNAVADHTGLTVDKIIPISKIPKTTSGKIQHFKLAEAYQSGKFASQLSELSALQQNHFETRTIAVAETWLLSTCREIMAINEIEATDNLFDWGINSLQSTRLAGYIKDWSGMDFNAWEVLRNPTIRHIAGLISTGTANGSLQRPGIVAARQEDHYNMSEGQRRFWMLHQYEEARTACNISIGYKLKGKVDTIAFKKALEMLSDRHESLRTTINYIDEEPKQVIHPAGNCNDSFEYIDLRDIMTAETDAIHIARINANTSFDLEMGPLWRCKLIQVSHNAYFLSFCIHHIISDGWSILLVFKELSALYHAATKNTDAAMPVLQFQAKDHVQAQLHSLTAITNEDYWKKELAGELPVLELPLRQARSVFQTFGGNVQRFLLSETVTGRLRMLSRNNEATLFMTLLAIVNVLFYKYTGQTDILIGTDTAGRDDKDLEKQIGNFLRTLPVRTRFERNSSFIDILSTVKGRLLDAYQHQDYSLEKVLRDIDFKKDMSRAPLFDVLVILQNFDQPAGLEKLGDAVKATSVDIDTNTSLLDLHFEFIERNGSLAYSICYNTDLFSANQVKRLGHHFAWLVESILGNPDLAITDYEILSPDERTALLKGSNGKEEQYPVYSNVVALFEQQTGKTPEDIAVRFAGESFTYNYINTRANQFANFLIQEYGVKPGKKIGLLVSPSEKMIIQLMAIYKTGAVFVPLSTEFPSERIRQIIDNSGIELLCTDQYTHDSVKHLPAEIIPGELFWEWAGQYCSENPVSSTHAEDIAYIMYTSGSTGAPKGVMVSHGAVLDYIQTFSRYFNLGSDDIVIQQSELTFDTAIEEIFPALAVGAAIVVLSNRGRNVDDILEAIVANKATVLSTTPLVINEINKQVESLASLRIVISGGDRLKASFIDKLIEKLPLYNTYGPTESTVCTTFNKLNDISDISVIGYPLTNRKVFILNEEMKPVPVGVKGELYIAGKGLAAGYLNNEEETTRRFVYAAVTDGERLYKSGDTGRWLEDGRIEFLGRKDSQVKINGYRVEIAEVEQAMTGVEEISDVAVESFLDKKGNKQLIAFYTGAVANEKYLRSCLLDVLPHYMVPSFFIHLDTMPVNANGKVDRKALPEAKPASVKEEHEQKAPVNKAEQKLLDIWKEVLGETNIYATDNFFELGGNSIAATRIAARIQKELNVKVLLKDLFIYPTIREQAVLISGDVHSDTPPVILLEESDYYDVSNAQKRIWLLDQFKEAKLAYNLSWAFELRGDLNHVLFEKSIQTIIARHEILRTNFITVDGVPKQKIHPVNELSFTINYADLRSVANNAVIAETMVSKETTLPFNLANDALLRVSLIRLGEDKHVFIFVIHHIISDGWSMQVLVHELVTLYNSLVTDTPAVLPVLPFQYKDYAGWQNECLAGNKLNMQKDYWLTRFSGDPVPVLAMPADYPRPLVQTYNGKHIHFSISETCKKKLAAIGTENDTSLFMVLLSAVYVLLYKYTQQEDIVIGTPVIGREREELENQMGLYLNTLALRTRFRASDSFRTLLNRVKTTALQAYEHQAFPFDWLVDELSPASDTSRSPLFDIMVGYQDIATAEKELNSLHQLTAIPCIKKNIISQFDLSVDFFEKEKGLSGIIEFNTDLFRPSYIERFIDQYITLLDTITSNTGVALHAIEYIPERQKKELLKFNDSAYQPAAYSTNIIESFEQQVYLYPDEIAVVCEDRSLTYTELNERANQLAAYLHEYYRIQPNDIVGLLTSRSADMIIYLLGILKSGAAYLPIDADYLSERVQLLMADSNMKILLSNQPDPIPDAPVEIVYLPAIEELLDSYPVYNPPLINKPSDLIYIIYTSGSTGKPKGVMVQHQNLSSVAESWRLHYGLDTFTVCSLQMASISFDVFMGDICRTLLYGGKLVICPSDIRTDTQRLYELIQLHQVNVLESTPGLILPLMEYVYEHQLDVSFIKLLIIGSDTCLIEDYKGLQTRFGSVMRIINSYGTTETTIDSSFYEEPVQKLPVTGTTPIGKPLVNTQYFVLDAYQAMLPLSVPGELYIGGAGVSGGYLHDEELQKKKFIANPFNHGNRLYRTGDIVRWLDDGNVQFMGRSDFQVKVRGYRIELGEIEDAMLRYAGVREVVVQARSDGKGDCYLVGYYVGSKGMRVTDLRNWLRGVLPGYMIPSYMVELSGLPLTSNGKVDRKALPAPELEATGTGYIAPRTLTEQKLATIWEEVLNRKGIGMEDNFFECGGHSLKAARIVSRIHKEFEVKVELRNLFTHPTIEGLSKLVDSAGVTSYEKIKRTGEQDYYGVSHAQRRLWILDQIEEDRVAYNMPGCYMLEGELNRESLSRAFMELIGRHEILRTRFVVVDGEPVQKIEQAEASGFEVLFENLEQVNDQEERIACIVDQELRTAFDLEKGPLLRSRLLQLATERHLLLFNMHHIISDGWSVEVLMKELSLLYNIYTKGEGAVLAELPVQYRDYSAWQNRELVSQPMRVQGDYWKQQFEDGSPVLGLSTDYNRPVTKTYKGSTVSSRLDSKLSEGIRTLSIAKGSSVFISLLSALKALLYRYTGQEDIVIGFPVSGRDHGELEGQIGFYVNTLALRTQFKGEESFDALLDRVKATTLNAYSHQQYPFDLLVEELDLVRDMSRSPLFDMLVVMQNSEQGQWKGMEGIRISEKELELGVSKFDMTISFIDEEPEGIGMQVEYNTDLYSRERVERMVDHYRGLWESVLPDTGCPVNRLEYLSAQEQQQLISQFNDTSVSYPSDKTLQELFEERVKQNPGGIAVMFEGISLSYEELNERANQLAHYLRNHHGIGRDMLVGLMVERSQWMLVGILGILKSGAAYVPVDPEYPENRRVYMAEDSGINLLITEKKFINNSWPCKQVDVKDLKIKYESTANPENINNSSDHAYVIYTSGTTGNPKGVQVAHRSVVNLSAWLRDIIYGRHEEPLRVSLTASISFDSSVKQLFPSLLNGSTLVIISAEERKDPALYIETLKRTNINLLDITPSYLKIVLDTIKVNNEHLPSLLYTLSGGESLSHQLVKEYNQVYGSNSKLVNVYGVTEATVDSTYEIITGIDARKSQLSIGKPVHNTQLYILDNHHNLLPTGIPGSLYIGGDGVSEGYINREKLTRERFIRNPVTGSGILYNTGDMARWMADGTVEFLGRNDRQVKIRGYRIELGEIEQTLLGHEQVKEAAVTVCKDKDGTEYLVAYFSERSPVEANILRSYLAEHLPAYMLPSLLMRVDEFARTANGKLDYQALPGPGNDPLLATGCVPPRNATEQLILAVWQEVLNRSDFGITDNFFHIGGDSLKAMKIFAGIYKKCGARLPIKTIFVNPTIEYLAQLVGENKRTVFTPIVPIPLQEDYELSHAQKRLWILNQFEKDQTAYNIPVGYIFKGQLQYGAFVKALKTLVERHEVLRTSFVNVNGEPRQKIHAPGAYDFHIGYIDARESKDIDSLVQESIMNESGKSFDLGAAPLLRANLLRTKDDEYTCLITLHHIISDAWSNNNLIKELSILYNAYSISKPNPLPPLPVQYKEYAVWQKKCLSGDQFSAMEQYWLNQFSGEVPLLELPTGRARPKIKTFTGDTICFDLGAGQAEALTALGSRNNATLFMVLAAIVNAQLYRYTSEEDIVITTPIAGREHPDLENQVGFYVNTLALRTHLNANEEFSTLLSNVRQVVLGAYTHQFYPFDMLTDKLGIPYDPSHAPLSEIMIVLQNAGQDNLQLDQLKVNLMEVKNTTSRFDLVIVFTVTGDSIKVDLTYNTSILDRDLVTDIAAHFRQIAEAVIEYPESRISQLPLLTTGEMKQVVRVTNDKQHPDTAKNIIQLFQEQVSLFPGHSAIQYSDHSITYSELDLLSDQLAHYLAGNHAIKTGDIVAIKINPSPPLLVGLLGILKTGASVMPVKDEKEFVKLVAGGETGSARLLINEDGLTTGLSGVTVLGINDESIYRHPGKAAYIHRNTGSAAWVIVETSNDQPTQTYILNDSELVGRATILRNEFGFHTGDRGLLLSAKTIHDTVYNMLGWILSGATAVIPAAPLDHEEEQLQFIDDHKVTILQLTPYQLYRIMDRATADDRYSLGALRYILVSGSKLCYPRLKDWMDKYPPEQIAIVNFYSTSITGPVAYYRIAATDIEPGQSLVGKAFSATELLILDEHLNILPRGIVGRLYAGIPVTKQVSKPLSQWVPHPLRPSAWLLRTDDLAVYINDGNINYISKSGDQISVQGKKINPASLETILAKCPGTKDFYIDKKGGVHTPGYYTIAVTPDDGAGYTVRQLAKQRYEKPALNEQLYYFPNGFCLFNKNKSETDFTYNEIFEQHGYMRYGIEIKPGDIVFDVGANIGMFSLYVSLNFPGTTVYAFEPLPPIYEMLEANSVLYKNSRIIPFNIGLSDQEQQAGFTFYSHNTIISGRYSNLRDDKETVRRYLVNQFKQDGISLSEKRLEELVNESTVANKYSCRLRRLSDIIKEQDVLQIDLLKVDVEKSEWEIMQGIADEDWKKIKQVIVEVHDIDGRLRTITQLLQEKGFTIAIHQDEVLKETNLYNLYGKRTALNEPAPLNYPAPISFNTQGAWTDPELFTASVRKYCADRLPGYILSAATFSLLPELPLDKTGRVDKKRVSLMTGNREDVLANADVKQIETLVSATFTAEPMGDYFLWWLKQSDIATRLQFAAYNQVFRDLLDPDKSPDIHILLVRFEDFIRDKNKNIPDEELISYLESAFGQLAGIISSCAGKRTYIAGIFPISPYLDCSGPVIHCLQDLTTRWSRLLQTLPGVYVVDFEEIINLYHITEVFDIASDKTGHIPFTDTSFAAMGTGLARRIRALRKPAFKVIALDCDNTLWKGVCGEEGATGVQVSGGYAELQRFMLKKFEEGFLLVLNSKNNEADVWEVFENNPGMILKKEHFISWRINWNSKSRNLKELAQQLNLDINSFCFIDDSDIECSEVMTHCPAVLTLQLPEDSIHFASFLQHVWAFDRVEVTTEDRQRNEMYLSEISRQELRNEQSTLEEFLAGLELQVSMKPAEDTDLQRVSQLTERTNQFNLHKKQYSAVDIKSIIAEQHTGCWTITVQDKFGDYGLTGVTITRIEQATLFLDSLLLSCRVLGRNVEQSLLTGLKKYALENKCTEIIADYWPTSRNTPVADFLKHTGWEIKEINDQYICYSLAISKIPDETPFVQFYYKEVPATGEKENTGREEKHSLRASRAFVPDHIGVAVKDMEIAGKYYTQLGYTASPVIYDPVQNVHLAIYTHDTLHTVELIAPNDERSPVNHILQKNGDIPYHICYRVSDLAAALGMLDRIGEYEVISQPQPAVLFGGKRVMFISVKHAGLVELLEDPDLNIEEATSRAPNTIMLRIVSPQLDKASLFYTKLGYYEDRISGNTSSQHYRVLLKHSCYASCLEIIMPDKQESSPENDFLSKNGPHFYQLALGAGRFDPTNQLTPPYMSEWNESLPIEHFSNREWNPRLVNEQELLHKVIYESLKYNSARSLTRIPLYNLMKAEPTKKLPDMPRTDTERKLSVIWEEILHQQQPGMSEPFFKLGGNSIKATQVLSRIENQLGIEIPLSQFFEHATLRELAMLVEKSAPRQNIIQPVARSLYYEVSSAQKRIWMTWKMEPRQVIYNIPAIYCIGGKLNINAMQQAMSALIERHESLRTTFTEVDSVPKQKIHDPETFRFEFVTMDLRDEPNGMSNALAMARETSLIPFNLENDSLIRVAIYRIEDEMYLFSQVVHHIIFDGWSAGIEMDDLLALYNYYNHDKTAKLLSPLPVQYKDFAAWENQQLQNEKLARLRNYWLEQFENDIPRLDLPYDFARPALKTHNGTISSFLVEPGLKTRIEALMKLNDTSLFMTMMSGICGVLYRFTGQQDMVLGVPYSNRHHSDLENQIGFYVNMLPIRLRFQAGASFRTILALVKQATLQAYDHGGYSFDRLVEDLHIPPDPGRTPLFDVMIQMQHSNVTGTDKQREDFSISPVEIDRGVSKYDLLFNIVESNEAINIDIEYNTDLFKPATISLIKDTVLSLFRIVTSYPEISMTELRKQLMGVDDERHLNYNNRIIAEIEQDF